MPLTQSSLIATAAQRDRPDDVDLESPDRWDAEPVDTWEVVLSGLSGAAWVVSFAGFVAFAVGGAGAAWGVAAGAARSPDDGAAEGEAGITPAVGLLTGCVVPGGG